MYSFRSIYLQLLPFTFFVGIGVPSPVSAGTVQLPRTGQTTCYDVSGAVITCAGTGQDGDKKTGVPWPKPRFVTSGDCVTDNLTGLMWVKAPEKTKVTWAKALADSNDMDLCGSTDWHLPNLNELESLINAEVPDTAVWLNTQQFTNVQPDQYWASTSSPYPPGPVIGVSAIDMRHGDVHGEGLDSYVWPVRNAHIVSTVKLPATGQTTSYAVGDDGDLQQGATWPPARLVDNGDGTVIDNLTGLTWLKDLNCRETVAGIPKTYGFQGWSDALGWSNGLSHGSCGLLDNSAPGEWRLPNRKELMSLLDRSQCCLALPAGSPFLNQEWGDYYWTSSTFAWDTPYAWIVSMRVGTVYYNPKATGSAYVVPVRGGPVAPAPDEIGVWRPSTRRFFLDSNGNNTWDGATGGDTLTSAFGLETDVPVTGDWNGDGTDDVGFWRPSTRRFYLDANGNDKWDGATGGDTLTSAFGLETDIPVTGDWNGDGTDDVGFWRPSTRRFYLDANGNDKWDGATGGDTLTSAFGLETDVPVTGDWNGDGTDDVGFWRPSTRRFYLDANGNDKWDGATGGDTLTSAFGLETDVPVTGDWSGDGTDDVGFWRLSTRRFYLDANGNDKWDGATGGDTLSAPFILPTDIPMTGHW